MTIDYISSDLDLQKFEKMYLYKWCQIAFSFIKNDLDFVEIVSGTEGSGKSTFALFKMIYALYRAKKSNVEINSYQMELFEKGDWETLMREYVFLSGKKFLEAVALDEGKKKYNRAIIIIDEAGRELFCRDSQNKINKMLIKFFITARFLNNIYLLCVPKPKYLDVYIREERAALISWIVLRVSYDYSTHTLEPVGRDLISLPRIAYQYFIEKFGWRDFVLNILKNNIEKIKQEIEENSSWIRNYPITGIFEIPHNLNEKFKHLKGVKNGEKIMEAYNNLKKGEGFREFIDEVLEKLKD